MGLWAEMDLDRVADLLAAAAVVAGLAVCLLGLRLWRAVLATVAFSAGYAVGYTIAVSRAPDQRVVVIGLGVAMGCVLMVVFAGMPRLGTFAVLAVIGWFAGRLLAGQAQVREQDLMVVAGLAGALVIGIVPFYFDIEKPATVLISSLAGAWGVVWGTTLYFGGDFCRVADAAALLASAERFGVELTAVALLALIGLAAQTTALLRSGPDARALRHAIALADLPTKRRVALLEDLRSNGLITRAEYDCHAVRVLSAAGAVKTRHAFPPKRTLPALARPAPASDNAAAPADRAGPLPATHTTVRPQEPTAGKPRSRRAEAGRTTPRGVLRRLRRKDKGDNNPQPWIRRPTEP